tara:strand:- start:218 stop:490 length:273 start_codon:yes stop_codon:yes gene_type:complete
MGGKVVKIYTERQIMKYNKKYNGKYKEKNHNDKYNDDFDNIYYDNNYNNKKYHFNPNAVKLRYLDTNSKHLTPEIKHSYVYKGVPGGWYY